jgi:hypothetical protein
MLPVQLMLRESMRTRYAAPAFSCASRPVSVAPSSKVVKPRRPSTSMRAGDPGLVFGTTLNAVRLPRMWSSFTGPVSVCMTIG